MIWINYNMRCIETSIPIIICNLLSINYNMRCIETHHSRRFLKFSVDKLQHEMY